MSVTGWLRGAAAPTMVLGSILLAGACGSATAAPSMPPGAFLDRPAYTPEELAQQAIHDHRVCVRYARLYQMPVRDVPAALRALHADKLKHDTIMQVHYMFPGDRIGYRVRRVRRGTRVFSLPNGSPVMVQVCGNPSRNVHPSALGLNLRSTSVTIPDFNPSEPITEVASAGEPSIGGLNSIAPGTELETQPVATVPNIVPVPTMPPVVPVAVVPPVTHIATFNAGLLFLAPLAAVPFLINNHHNPPGPPPPNPPGPPPPPPPPPNPPSQVPLTPEPGSLAYLAAAASTGMMLRWRLGKRRAN